MEKEFDRHGPMIVQIRRFNSDNSNYWVNVKGYEEGTGEAVLAEPEDKLTMQEALVLFKKLNPSGMSAIHRIIHWHWPEQRA